MVAQSAFSRHHGSGVWWRRPMGVTTWAANALAVITLLTGCAEETPSEIVTGPVTSFVISAGDGQAVKAGTALPISPAVRVTDAADVGVPGVAVSFIVTAGGGSVVAPVVHTDASGTASAPWTVGMRVADAQRLLVAAADPESGASFGLEFTASVLPDDPARLEVVSGNAQFGPSAAELALPLVVRVTDTYQNPVDGAAVSWAVTDGGGTLSASSTTTDTDGQASVRWTLGSAEGPVHTATATVDTLPPVTFDAEGGALPSAWEDLPAMLVPVRAPAAAAKGDSVYVIGGTTSAGRSNRLQIFDIVTGTWSSGSDVPVSADWWSAAFAGGRLHLIGGVMDGVAASNQHWIYDPTTNIWTSGTPAPFRTAGSAIASDGTKIYVAGGIDGPGSRAAHLQIYDDPTESWSTGASVPAARITWAGAWVDGRLLAVGGEAPSNQAVADLFAYDPGANTWSQLASMGSAREAHGGAEIDGFFCAFGGRGLSSVECYSPDTGVWERAAPLLRVREEAGTVAVGGAVYVLGGRERSAVLRHASRFVLN